MPFGAKMWVQVGSKMAKRLFPNPVFPKKEFLKTIVS